MAKIIYQIPGYENRVQRISATDEVSESFIVAQMADVLRKKWNTSVLCMSLDGHKGAIESLIPQEKAVGNVYIMDQKNPTLEVVIRKATGIINRRFVRAVIISGADRIRTNTYHNCPDKERARIELRLNNMAQGLRIPIILVETH